MSAPLEGKVVLITGGARRVGAAIARRLHGAGANLVVHYRSSAAEARELKSGLTKARPGAGICIVGNPEQCADVLQKYIDIGCHSFCLSGYLHDAEAERFHRMVRPILADRNRARMKAA